MRGGLDFSGVPKVQKERKHPSNRIKIGSKTTERKRGLGEKSDDEALGSVMNTSTARVGGQREKTNFKNVLDNIYQGCKLQLQQSNNPESQNKLSVTDSQG